VGFPALKVRKEQMKLLCFAGALFVCALLCPACARWDAQSDGVSASTCEGWLCLDLNLPDFGGWDDLFAEDTVETAVVDVYADDVDTAADTSELVDLENGGADAAVPPDLESADAEIIVPPLFDPTVCDSKPHSWLPSAQVGQVVSWEESLLTNLTPEFINEGLAEAGYEELNPVPYGARNFKLRYVTQDRGTLLEATAVVGIPVGMELSEPIPIIMWSHGTTGFMDDCAPSSDAFLGPAQTAIVSSLGYVTVAPDYIGMLGFGEPSPPGTIHPYLVSEATAIACLDAVRAAIAALSEMEDVPVPDPGRLALWGGSQGGHAVFATELYAPYYAPEFAVAAAAAAVPPTDVLGHAEYGAAHFGDTAETMMAVLVAMRAWYGHPKELTTVFSDTEPNFLASNISAAMAGSCSPKAGFTGLNGLTDIYSQDFLDNASAGNWEGLYPWGCFLTENTVGRESVVRLSDTPFLATYAENDELVITELERESVQRLCESGYRIEYLECAGEDHVSGALAGVAYTVDWISKRVSGVEWPEEGICKVTAPVDCSQLMP